MLHKGKQSASRKLVWVEAHEMKRTFQVQLSEEFTCHACAEHHRVKGGEALSA